MTRVRSKEHGFLRACNASFREPRIYVRNDPRERAARKGLERFLYLALWLVGLAMGYAYHALQNGGVE